MKPSILLLAAISTLAISSCTTAYKTGQTPDDVYYSPVRPEDDYVQVEKKSDKKNEERYQGSDDYYDDRYLRMRVRNRTRWSELDDWYYYGNRYTYTYSYYNPWGIHNPWNPYTYWNCAYNPYYNGNVIIGPKSPTYSKPRFFNLNAYNNNSLTNNTYNNPKAPKVTIGNFGNNSYNNSNRGNNAGSFLRDIFMGGSGSSSSGSKSSGTSPASTGSSSSGSSSGSKGSSAPARRF